MSGCGGGQGHGVSGCGGGGKHGGHAAQEPDFPVMSAPLVDPNEPVARVNGVALHAQGRRPDEPELRQRVCIELLRQAAQRAGLLDAGDAPQLDGSSSAEASQAIDELLNRELRLPEPDEESLRRHHRAHPARFGATERVQLRHVLFAVTPGVDLNALRKRAEALLLELRCADAGDGAFGRAAAELSNCPSGAQGGELGWVMAQDVAPEFGQEIFGHTEIGVLPRLVHSRHGLHVVEVLAREGGEAQPFEQVRVAVSLSLQQQAWITALRQYLRVLGGEAEIEHASFEVADSPLVQ
jgi:peptidyl-prolyl cis-trans isomerase C